LREKNATRKVNEEITWYTVQAHLWKGGLSSHEIETGAAGPLPIKITMEGTAGKDLLGWEKAAGCCRTNQTSE